MAAVQEAKQEPPTCRKLARQAAPGCVCRFVLTTVVITALLFLNLLLVLRITFVQENWHELDLSYRLPKIRDRGLLPFDEGFEYNFVVDSHSHTYRSDGYLSPQQLVDYAVAEGLDGIVVTDHQETKGGLEAREYAREMYPLDIVVLPGMEYTSCRLHMNLINFSNMSTISHLMKVWPTDEELMELLQVVHDAGGIVVINHIPWSTTQLNRRNAPTMTDHPTLPQLVEMGIDGVEIANGFTFDMQSALYVRGAADSFLSPSVSPSATASANASTANASVTAADAANVTAGNGTSGNTSGHTATPLWSPMALVGGSDTHWPQGFHGLTAMRLDRVSEAMSDPEAREAAVMAELRAHRTSIVFDAVGSPNLVTANLTEAHYWFKPLLWLHSLMEGVFYSYDRGMADFAGGNCYPDKLQMHGSSIAAFVLYAVVIFLLIESCYLMWHGREIISKRLCCCRWQTPKCKCCCQRRAAGVLV